MLIVYTKYRVTNFQNNVYNKYASYHINCGRPAVLHNSSFMLRETVLNLCN